MPAERDGKRQHVVEVLNTVDKGTSILVEAQVRADFNAETTLQEIASLLRTHGLPHRASVTAWAWPSISATHTSRSKTAL